MGTFRELGIECLRLLGIDRAVLLSITGKVWGMASGLLTTVLIALYFSPELQGFYYTFGSVLAIQVFAELGLGTVLISYASHEWANLSLDANGAVTGDAAALSRLRSLGRFALSWYFIAGGAVTVLLIFGGLAFFSTHGETSFAWRAPWIAVCLVAGLNLCLVPAWAIMEGCNRTSSVYGNRLVQMIVASTVGWLAIYFGAGLWTSCAIGLTGLVIMAGIIGLRDHGFVRSVFLVQSAGPRLNWKKDILPMQWRIAVSWVGGYFSFYLFMPVLFQYHGPVVAGRMGMTWAFANALMAISAGWVSPKAPRFGILIAQGKYAELDRLFWRVWASITGVTVLGAICIWGLIFTLDYLHHPFAARLLPPATAACLLAATVLVGSSLPFSTYLRAHKQEPLMVLSVGGGILTGATVWLLGKYFSAEGVGIGYLISTAAVTPLVALIWHRKRIEWHGRTPGPNEIHGG